MTTRKPRLAVLGIRGIPANYGGFETCAEETTARLARDFDVYVFCRRHNRVYRGARLVVLPSVHTKSLDTLTHTLLATLYLLFRPDIRVVHLYNAANAIFIPILRLFGKKVYVSVDCLEWKRTRFGRPLRAYYRFAGWMCAKLANRVVADSRVVKRFFDTEYGTDAEYIAYGATVAEHPDAGVLRKYGLEPRRYVYFVGRLIPDKGVHHLIEAYDRVRPAMPLVIIGDDDVHPEYVARLKSRASRDVRFLGYLYGEDYLHINAFAYLYASASQMEGTSPSLLTAMAAGNCVLVNGVEENADVVGDAGVTFRENDVEDLARQLKRLTDDPALVEQYRAKAVRHARSNYDWDVIAGQYARLFGKRDAHWP